MRETNRYKPDNGKMRRLRRIAVKRLHKSFDRAIERQKEADIPTPLFMFPKFGYEVKGEHVSNIFITNPV